jgi:hypothetical protein
MSRGRTKRLERLARWYWNLPEAERERVKQLHNQRMRDDPEFRADVANSLRVAELRDAYMDARREARVMSEPPKEFLAQALRDHPTWGHAAYAEHQRAERAEAALREIVDRHERPCGVHEVPLPCDVALAETYGIARAALARREARDE